MKPSQRIKFQPSRIGESPGPGGRSVPVSPFSESYGRLCRQSERVIVPVVVFPEESHIPVSAELAVHYAPVYELQGAGGVDPGPVGLYLGLSETDIP